MPRSNIALITSLYGPRGWWTLAVFALLLFVVVPVAISLLRTASGTSRDPAMNFGPPDIEDSLVAVNGRLVPVRATLHN